MNDPEDQAYLRAVQYRDGSNLSARARLHERYSTAAINWFDFVTALVDWSDVSDALDVGCGTGLVWPAIDAVLSRPLSLTLTDLSAGMVDEAKTRISPLARVAVVRTEVADVQALPFDDASFDVVLANHMLYHVPDRPQAVRELRRVLRPHGRLVAGTNGPLHMRELDALTTDSNSRGYAAAFGRENGHAILSQSFGYVTWHPHEDSLRCTDADAVVAYVASMAPEHAPSAKVRTEVETVMAANDGVFAITKDTGAFVASQ